MQIYGTRGFEIPASSQSLLPPVSNLFNPYSRATLEATSLKQKPEAPILFTTFSGSHGLFKALTVPLGFLKWLSGKESACQGRKMQMWIQSLGQEDTLEEEMAAHSSIPTGRIPWAEEPGGLQSMGSQRLRHDWATMHAHKHSFSNKPTNQPLHVLFLLCGIPFFGFIQVNVTHSSSLSCHFL